MGIQLNTEKYAMAIQSTDYRYVSYLWDEHAAAELAGDEVALLVYRSNILGADLRLTNFGGGNTSCKVMAENPLTGSLAQVMWIKGSGGDLGTLSKAGLAALYVDRLQQLKKRYRGLEFEDEMVRLFAHCMYDPASAVPSIDTALHAFLPFKHIDHLHPDAAIAIAAAKDGKRITAELFGQSIGWIDWQRPGFDLGLKLQACVLENPGLKGIMLGSHGLFTWGDTSRDCYENTLGIIEKCGAYIEGSYAKNDPPFGGAEPSLFQEIPGLSDTKSQQVYAVFRRKQAALIAPVLRGFCSEKMPMVGHFSDDARVLEFVNSRDLRRLAAMGTSCPDHFLRTKISPLVLELVPDADLADLQSLKAELKPAFEEYREKYRSYYATCKRPGSPGIRDSNPVVILYPGIGLFTFARDKQTARVAAEFYTNAINVMKGAEAISDYTALSRQEAFDIEYWQLEEAKLQRTPKPKPLSGRIALITGSAGGIGKAIARRFIEEGAVVLLNDLNAERLARTVDEFGRLYSRDTFAAIELDVTEADQIAAAMQAAALSFGGLDLLVNNAGLSISKSIADHTEADWDLLYKVLVKGQFFMTQAVAALMKKQGMGGDIINIVSKNALVSGPDNAGYGSAKAAQLHLSRLNAAELGADKIRVNVINPDAVISDSNIWAGGWAEGRALAYGISVDELPAFYARRSLLDEIILPEDIASCCLAFVGGLLAKSTGNILNVDGGLAAAFVR